MNETYHLEGSNGDVILFDDVQYAILRDSLSGLSGIPVEYDVSYSPGLIGGDVHSASIIERELSLHVAVIGNSRQEIEQLRKNLITALNPVFGESKLFWHREDGEVFYLRVRPSTSSPSFEVGTSTNPKYWDCMIELVCYDPCWYSAIVNTKEFVRLAKGFKLPIQFPFIFGNRNPDNVIVNNGSLPTPVEIVLHGKLIAPIVITNATSGKSLTIRRDIADNETITINTSPDNTTVTTIKDQDIVVDENRKSLVVTTIPAETSMTVSVNTLTILDSLFSVFSVDGSALKIAVDVPEVKNALYYCSIGSKFWQLEPGTNSIVTRFTQVYNNAYGTISYRERYIGL